MWQRFTERARRVILLGQEEAGKMNSGHVGTEHLLLGLVRENEGMAARILQRMGISSGKVRQEIEAEVQPGADPGSAEPQLTPKAKRVLKLAADEARRMRHNYIGTEHLLLALLREKDGLAATVLRRCGADLERVRALVGEELTELSQETPTPAERKTDVQNDREVAEVLERAIYWATMADKKIGLEHLLLALLEQKPELWADVTGLDTPALQKAHKTLLTRLELDISLDLSEEAAQVSDEIQNQPTMFEPPLTERGRRTVLLAQEEARGMGLNIYPEHILLGIFRDEESVAAQFLRRSNVDYVRVRQAVEDEFAEQIACKNDVPDPQMTPKAQRVLDFAADESRRTRHNYIGTEHLLLATLRWPLSARIQESLGTDPAELHATLNGFISPVDDEPSHPTPEPAPAMIGNDERILLDLLERRRDLLSNTLGLTDKALQKARLQLIEELGLSD